MTLSLRLCDLQLANPWKIASSAGADQRRVVILELTDGAGVYGLGEAALPSTSAQTVEGILDFCRRLDPGNLSFAELSGSMAWLDTLDGMPAAAQCGLNVALLDGAARRAGKPIYDFLNLDGNLLTTNDPFAGVSAEKGVVSFASATAKTGLRVSPRK